MNQRERSREKFGRRARRILFLLSLLKISGNSGELFTNTTSLAQVLGMSQQTASLLLRELMSDGMITRHMSRAGERIVLTPRAYEKLAQELAGVSLRFRGKGIEPSDLKVSGKVFAGKGEGAYYISQRGYFKQIEAKLGFSPYLGTLNLRLSSLDELNRLMLLYNKPAMKIKGFTTRERTFGDVYCYEVRVKGVANTAVIRSDRTAYDMTTVELISDRYLRKTIGLKDGDALTFSFPA